MSKKCERDHLFCLRLIQICNNLRVENMITEKLANLGKTNTEYFFFNVHRININWPRYLMQR